MVRLLGLRGRLLGDLLLSSVLVMLLLCVVGVLGVLSLCCGGLKGHLDPLRAVLVLVVFFIPEFFVTADVFALSLLRECEVLGEVRDVSFRGGHFIWEDLKERKKLVTSPVKRRTTRSMY